VTHVRQPAIIARCASFPAEPFKGLGVFCKRVRKEFERDETPEFRILGLIHHAHTTTIKFIDDTVMRDCLADKRIGNCHVRSC